jgi:hypothetical protein
MSIRPDGDLRELLAVLAGATEFADLRVRAGEAPVCIAYSDVEFSLTVPRSYLTSCEPALRYLFCSMSPSKPTRKSMFTSSASLAHIFSDKVFLYLQVTFGNVSLESYKVNTENSSPAQIGLAIFLTAPRIVDGMKLIQSFAEADSKAIRQVVANKGYGTVTRAATELLHVVHGKAWENHPAVFRQIPSIGKVTVLIK